MSARLLDGTALARLLHLETARRVQRLVAAGRRRPGLAVILVGDDPASRVYVAKKGRACERAGLVSRTIQKPAQSSTASILEEVRRLNQDDDIDGILVQLPLPQGRDTERILAAVQPDKDVDGFHPLNAGALAQGRPRLVPCTPAGILELLQREEFPLAGSRAVVLGRSVIVGRPMALLLVNHHATVTVAHSQSRDLPALCRQADLLVVAMGRPGAVTEEYVKPGATVIDVGINRVIDPQQAALLLAGQEERLAQFKSRGRTLVGDVHLARVKPVAGAMTPVPGGIGPLTVAMLLKNTLKAYQLRETSGENPSCGA